MYSDIELEEIQAEIEERKKGMQFVSSLRQSAIYDAYGKRYLNEREKNEFISDKASEYVGLVSKFQDSFWDSQTYEDDAVKLKGSAYYDDLLKREDKIYKAFWVRVVAAQQRIKFFQPAHENCERCKLIQEFIEENFRKLGSYQPGTNFNNLVAQIMLSIVYGFTLHEIVLTEADAGSYKGKLMLKYLKHRDQYNFEILTDKYDNIKDYGIKIKAVTLFNDDYEVTFRRDKFLITQFNPSKGNPYGHSAVEMRLGFMCLLKRLAYEFWGVRMQRYGIPSVKVTLSGYNDKQQSEKAEAIVRQYKNRSGVVLPKGMVMELLEAKESGNSNIFASLIQKCDEAILNCLNLTEYATDDTKGSGAGRAASKQHGMVRDQVTQSDCNWIADTINTQVIYPLISFNYPQYSPEHYVSLIYPEANIKYIYDFLDSINKMSENWTMDVDRTLRGYNIYLPGLKKIVKKENNDLTNKP